MRHGVTGPISRRHLYGQFLPLRFHASGAQLVPVGDDIARGRGASPRIRVSKAFDNIPVLEGGRTKLAFTLASPPSNTAALTGVALTDNLPSGMVVATPNGFTGSCGGGSVAAAPGSQSVALTGATLTVGETCSFALDVTPLSHTTFYNETNAPTSDGGGTGNTASAVMTANPGLTIAISPGTPQIPQLGSTSITYTLTNQNPSLTLTGVAATASFDPGLAVGWLTGLTGSCGNATLASSLTIAGWYVNLRDGTLPPGGSCSFTVWVTGGSFSRDLGLTANATSDQASSDYVSATLTLGDPVRPPAPPALHMAFVPARIPIGGTSLLTFTITNPNPATTLTDVGFADLFPSGLLIASPANITGSCGEGTIAINPVPVTGASSISLSGATLAPISSCSFAVAVVTTRVPTVTNTTFPTSHEANGSNDTASLNVGNGGMPADVPVTSYRTLLAVELLLLSIGLVALIRQAQSR